MTPFDWWSIRAFPALRRLCLAMAVGQIANALPAMAEVPVPACKDGRLEFTLYAAEPQIVTPIGVAADLKGKIFVVESHTHFPKADYPGPKTDRVKIFHDRDGDGKPDTNSIFAEGFRYAMNLAFAPDGQLYLVHRNGVLILHDRDSDGISESRTSVLEMDTPGNYPHNGLGGIAFSNDGWLYIGMGENLGERYVLKGSDGSKHSGGGEGGNVFRCRPDGSQLQFIATGFWNAFALEFNRAGHLFCVDNDPDSRPPCRLLDVVEQGDYGYKFRYGRSGLHPFTAWNGELPGTLPMVAGTGEAPSGILNGDRARLPSDYQEALFVTSWGDHDIEVFRPKPFGASVRAEREVLIQGGEWFRPVGITAGPDGAIYISDWVDRDYSVHGKGRIWRLSAKAGVPAKIAAAESARIPPSAERERMKTLLRAMPKDHAELLQALREDDPFVRSAAISALARPYLHDRALRYLEDKEPKVRLGALLALRRGGYQESISLLRKCLADADERVRLMALIWIGERKWTDLADGLNVALSSGPVSPALFRTYSTTAEVLAKARPTSVNSGSGEPARTNENVQTLVMNMVVRRDPEAAIELLSAGNSNLQLRLEAVRTLAESENKRANAILLKTALQKENPVALRAEAIVAMGSQPADALIQLLGLLDDAENAIQIEAARAFRQTASDAKVRDALQKKLQALRAVGGQGLLADQLEFALSAGKAESGNSGSSVRQPDSDGEWRKALAPGGDVASGRRVFFHPAIGCAKCHRIEDHGGSIGPDLSTIARSSDREKLMQSILHPSREIAPQWVQHSVETSGDQSYTGLLGGRAADDSITLITADGKGVFIPARKIASIQSSTVSLMPDGLEKAMTVQDFRDLLAFLSSLQ